MTSLSETDRKQLHRLTARERVSAIRLADAIWELAEPPLAEVRSARLLADYLAACLCWHPDAENSVRSAGGAAMDSLV